MMRKLINRGLLFPQNPKVPWAYPVLAPLSRCYPRHQGRLSTRYSPVRHFHRSKLRITFDLHVLSTPPAFVLSQDQTLQFNFKTGKSDSSLKQLTFIRHCLKGVGGSLLQNPQCCFVYYLVFKDQAAFAGAELPVAASPHKYQTTSLLSIFFLPTLQISR